jgi:hypothetical protein
MSRVAPVRLFGALLLATSATAAPAVGDARYLGRTSQGEVIVIETASTGRAIGAMRTSIAYDGLCGERPGSPRYQLLSYSEARLRANGSFSYTTTATAEGRGPQALPVRLAGTFTGRSVRGTLTAVGRDSRCGAGRPANPYRATFSARVAR